MGTITRLTTGPELEGLRAELRDLVQEACTKFCTAHADDDVPPEATMLVVLAGELALVVACLGLPMDLVFEQLEEAHVEHMAMAEKRAAEEAGPKVPA